MLPRFFTFLRTLREELMVSFPTHDSLNNVIARILL
jgi:hypothetical protein